MDEDEALITASIAGPATVAEANAGFTRVTFTITLSAAASVETVVAVALADGSAQFATDYIALATATLPIPAGQTSVQFAIDVVGDIAIEGDESLSVVLTGVTVNPEVAVGPQNVATVTIIDDDEGTPPATSQTVSGGEGGDLLGGSGANDLVQGLGGNDMLFGLGGSDIIDGGAGDDVILGDVPGTGNDSILGGDGADTVFAGGGSDTVRGGAGRDFVIGDDGADLAFGDQDDDVLFGGAGFDALFGDDGNDFLFGDAGNDTMEGGAGNDRLHVDGQDGFADGNAGGFDVLVLVDNAGLTAIDLGDSVNQNAGGGAPRLLGFEAVDASIATAAVSITGAAFNGLGNVLFGSGFGDTITGSAAADILLGNGGADAIAGGNGNDTLLADAGNDTVTGGAGADSFFYPGGDQAGAVVVSDFVPADDAMLLGAGLGLTAAQALGQTQQVGADAVLSFGGGRSITFVGVDVDDLSANDFVIV